MFRALMETMGRPELADDPRFTSNDARMANVEALEDHIADWTRTLTAAAVLAKLQAIGVPSAKVARVSELVVNPHLEHRGQIIHMEHPKAGSVPMQGFSVHFGDSPMRLNHPPPMLGQHTDAILEEWLAMTGDQVGALRKQGVV
jgi:crotonobetainyl-CoA:carnitine CoA-transferase CaiB-like acyl-CoA transferase